LSLVGDSEITLLQGKLLEDPGANATDTFDQNLQVVSSASPTRNAINVMAYNKRATDEELNLASDTGILTWTPDGSALLREGPTGKGLSIFGAAQFQTLGANITGNNEFSTIFTGLFQAKVSGEYAFGITAEDDRGAFWLDLDQDGEFETVGDRGGEHMNGSFGPGYSYAVLQPGYYKFAVAHTENLNWEAIEASFRGPEGGGPAKFTTINPRDPSQDNLWWALPSSPIDTLVPGEYDITYSAVDEAGNAASTVTRKVTVVADTEPPVITLAGESSINHQIGIMYNDLGATATDNSGATITVESSLSFPTAGLVGQWTFDDGTPTDSSGNRYHGKHHGNPVYDNTDLPVALAGRGGNSINFADGQHAVVVDTGGDQDVFNLKNITVSLWVKGLTGNNATMISKEANNDRGWAIRRNGTTKNIESRWCIAGNDHTATGDILDDGEWHHVAASWDGRIRTLYIDGEINVQSSSSGSIKPTNRLLVIGARDNGGYGMPESAWYNGKLDDIAIYDRALKPDEVAALAEGASGIDITQAGTHTITYTATDPAGNISTATRTVVVADDPAKPVITLLGDEEITLEIGTPYVEPGVTVADSQGNAITDAEPVTTQDLRTDETGINKIHYDYVDPQGRAARTVTRIITIVDTTAPVISLVGVEPPVMLDQDDANQSAYLNAWNDGSD
ncbi:MAG: immunoglobulin-like domain-containing protein, partial [Opitutae bacterium]